MVAAVLSRFTFRAKESSSSLFFLGLSFVVAIGGTFGEKLNQNPRIFSSPEQIVRKPGGALLRTSGLR
jgi:hypothetical protein